LKDVEKQLVVPATPVEAPAPEAGHPAPEA